MKKPLQKIMILIISLLIFLLNSISVVSNSIENDSYKVIFVDDNAAPAWYDETHVKTISEGIANSSDGDVVYVLNGTYCERVVVDKEIILFGEHKSTTIIDSEQKGNSIMVTKNNVKISGFTITNSSNESSDNFSVMRGIEIKSNNNEINDNIITNHKTGIYLCECSENKILKNTIADNDLLDFVGEGINLYESDNNEIKGNNLSNNKVGISFKKSSANSISLNDLNSNKKGIYFINSNNNEVAKNNFIDNNIDAAFVSARFFDRNKWIGNYWEESTMPPKIIKGKVGGLFFHLSWVNFDWTPAEEPIDTSK